MVKSQGPSPVIVPIGVLPLLDVNFLKKKKTCCISRTFTPSITIFQPHNSGYGYWNSADSDCPSGHLHQQLIQRVLALVVAAAPEAAVAAFSAHRVDLVDEDDGRGLGTGLEEVWIGRSQKMGAEVWILSSKMG